MVSDLINIQEQKPAPLKKMPEEKEISDNACGRLIVINSSAPELMNGDVFTIDRDIVLGRGSSSNIVVKDTYTSNQHARVFIKNGHCWLEDMGSTNGTFLNDVQVQQPIILADGDRLRVGGVTFQFVRWGHEVGLYN
jgi:pSer/pThr/pTyr-binding forkhead associated (FHA) protein